MAKRAMSAAYKTVTVCLNQLLGEAREVNIRKVSCLISRARVITEEIDKVDKL